MRQESILHNGQDNTSESDNQNRADSEEEVIEVENRSEEYSENEEDDYEIFYEKTKEWHRRCMMEDENFVHLPKIWGEKLNKIRKKMTNIFEGKITNLLDRFENIMNKQKNKISEEEEFYMFEGVLSKIYLIIRKEIRKTLRIPKHLKKSRKHLPHGYELPIQLKCASKFTSGIELIHEIRSEEIDNQTNRNIISDLKEKLLRFLEEAPEDFTNLIGERTAESIEALLASENFEERLEFLKNKLIEIEKKKEGSKSKEYEHFIQKAYHEDSRKAMEWFIREEDTPECIVPVDSFFEDYGQAWMEAAPFEQDDEFRLERTLQEEDIENLVKLLMDEKLILTATNSRSNLSAVGCDGISNGIWKSGNKTTVRLIRLILKMMLSCKRFPDSMKICKTVMLYKKGDPRETRSWRPITITPTLYRIVMCHISRSLQMLNEQKKFICNQQKGFMKIPAGAAEHIITVDEMIHDASRHQKSLYIMTIDFKDAFGSVPHKLIQQSMKDIGLPKNLIKSIMNSYDGSCTRIISNGRRSEKIEFGKGVKQGCPLSPTLFNLCIEPLLRRLNQSANEYGYHWFGTSTSVQAYADDVILFSDSEEGMNNLIDTVERFCKYAGNMFINAKKCTTFAYTMSGRQRTTISNHFKINGENVVNINIQSYTTYLGLPITARITQRKNHIYSKLLRIREDVMKIVNSKLKITQMIDAIKRFVLPSVDYELMINAAPTIKLKDTDRFIRARLMEIIGAEGIPKDWFYMSKKDGGINLQSLCERHKALTIRTYISMRESEDANVRRMIKQSDDAEFSYRDVVVDVDSPYLRVPVKQSGSIEGKRRCGTSNLLSRTIKSLVDLEFGLLHVNNAFILKDLRKEKEIQREVENSNINTDVTETDTSASEYTENEPNHNMTINREDEDNEEVNDNIERIVNRTNVMKIEMKIIQKRHRMIMVTHGLKGHTFTTLENSPLSNFFINPNSPTANSIVKFAFQARTGSLYTGVMKSLISHKEADDKCKLCGERETIHHVLNGCSHKKHMFTKRHNEVVDVIRDYVEKDKKMITHGNQVVRGRGSERLDGDTANLKPDLWWWNGDKLTIVEFTIPYGMLSDQGNTLEIRRKQKLRKYEQLVEECKTQFNCEAELLVLIVSSLGAIPNDTIHDLRKITNNKKDTNILAKRMVITALRESMFLFYNWRPDERNNRLRENNGNETETETDTGTEAEVEEREEIRSSESEEERNRREVIEIRSSESEEERNRREEEWSVNDLSEEEWRRLLLPINEVLRDSSSEENTEEEKEILEDGGTKPYWNQERRRGRRTNTESTSDEDKVQQSSVGDSSGLSE